MKIETVDGLPLGQIVITAKARGVLRQHEVLAALFMHASEPWGKSFYSEKDEAEKRGIEERRLVSNHVSSDGQLFKIATQTGEVITTVFILGEKNSFEFSTIENWLCSVCPGCGE